MALEHATVPILDDARGQRAGLHHAVVALEEAIAAPAPGRARDWSARVHDALVDVSAAFERHIAVTEGPDGLLEDVTRTAPRLTNAARTLGDEHAVIRTGISESLVAVRALAHGKGSDGVAEVREALLELIARLSRHRQRGADLVFEAYAVDIGGED